MEKINIWCEEEKGALKEKEEQIFLGGIFLQTGLTSNVLEEVLAERESLIITLLADDFRERALLLTTRSAMFDQISVTNFEQSICSLSR